MMMLNGVTAQNLLSRIIILDRENLPSSLLFVIPQASILNSRSIINSTPTHKMLTLKFLMINVLP